MSYCTAVDVWRAGLPIFVTELITNFAVER